jgi:hypothetical protein
MSWLMAEYMCECGLRLESLERRADVPPTVRCECGRPARRTISAPHTKTTWCAPAVRGKPEERPGPGTVDTRAIADGEVSVSEWRSKRQALWRDRARSEWKARVG